VKFVRKRTIVFFVFCKTFYPFLLRSNKHSPSHLNNNNIVSPSSSFFVFYQVTGCMTSDEIGRMNTCTRTFLVYSSIDSSYLYIYVLMQDVLMIRFLSCLPINCIEKRIKKKNKRIVNEKKMLLMTMLIHR
jgi:hypothetical protein